MTPLPALVFWKSAMTCLFAVFITEKPTTLTLPFPPPELLPLAGSEHAAVVISEAVSAAAPNHRRVFGRVVDRFISGEPLGQGRAGRGAEPPRVSQVTYYI